jgi:hypothetical protein
MSYEKVRWVKKFVWTENSLAFEIDVPYHGYYKIAVFLEVEEFDQSDEKVHTEIPQKLSCFQDESNYVLLDKSPEIEEKSAVTVNGTITIDPAGVMETHTHGVSHSLTVNVMDGFIWRNLSLQGSSIIQNRYVNTENEPNTFYVDTIKLDVELPNAFETHYTVNGYVDVEFIGGNVPTYMYMNQN